MSNETQQRPKSVSLKRLMTVRELSHYLAMPVPTVYAYVARGTIPADCVRRIGRALKFETAAVDRWVSAQGAPQGSAQA